MTLREQLLYKVNNEIRRRDFFEFCLYYDHEFFSQRAVLKEVAEAFNYLHNEYHKGHAVKVSVSMPPRMGKCMHPETIIYTENKPTLLKDIVVGDRVISFKEGVKVIETVLAKESSVKKQVVIKYLTGETITVSPEHRLLTFKGYKKAKDITLNDFLIGYSSFGEPGNEINDDILTFLTYMIFEGHCRKNISSFTAIEKYTIDHFIEVCDRLDIPTRITSKSGTEAKSILLQCTKPCGLRSTWVNKSNRILLKYRLLDHLCYTKRLPDCFFTMPDCQKWKFLGVMFRTDGFFCKGYFGVTLANEGLITDIIYLCRSLGLKPTFSKKYNKQFDSYSWNLRLGASQIQPILDNCDLGHKREAAEKLGALEGYSFFEVYPQEILKHATRAQSQEHSLNKHKKKNISKDKFDRMSIIFPEILKHKMQDFYYMKIKSIEFLAEEIEMMDIQTTGVNNFVANGIVSHNSYICSLFCAWWLGNNPTLSVMRNSVTSDLYEKLSRDVRSIVDSDKFKIVFPLARLHPTQQNIARWSLTRSKQGAYFGNGVGGKIIGFGANLAITDDLYGSFQDAMSIKYQEGVDMWKQGTHNSRMEKNCPEIFIGTRWSKRDEIGKAIDKGVIDREITLPALVDYVEDGVVKQKSICEAAKSTAEYLAIKEETDETIWEAEYMQNPVEVKGLLFPLSGLHSFTPDEIAPYRTEHKFLAVDPADSGGDNLSAPVCKLYGTGIYVTDVIYSKDGTDETVPRLVSLLCTEKFHEAHIEGNGGWEQLAKWVKEKVYARSPELETEIRTTKAYTNKQVRILSNAAFIRNHFYFLAKEFWTPEYKQFMKTLTSYLREGGSNQVDDAPDSLVMAAEYYANNFRDLW